jgi:hypothetical protein
MTQDEIIDMARQAEFFISPIDSVLWPKLEAFYKLVAAKEREACAKVVDDWSDWHGGTELIAAVIRERGQA